MSRDVTTIFFLVPCSLASLPWVSFVQVNLTAGLPRDVELWSQASAFRTEGLRSLLGACLIRPYAGVPRRKPLPSRGAPKRSIPARVGELLRAVGLWREGAGRASAHLVPGVAHTGLTASPTLTQSIPYATPTPTTSPILCPLPGWGRGGENSQQQDPQTLKVSLRPCELHLSGLLHTHPGPSLTTRCLHPSQAILLTTSCLHPCPSALHSLWQTLVAAHSSGSPAPHPLLPSFSLSLSLSFLCLPPSIGASNHRYP